MMLLAPMFPLKHPTILNPSSSNFVLTQVNYEYVQSGSAINPKNSVFRPSNAFIGHGINHIEILDPFIFDQNNTVLTITLKFYNHAGSPLLMHLDFDNSPR